jgi:flagellar hook protein FlgE
MSSFSIPLSGLTANSEALDSIANNLANMNTIGYKDTRTLFQDMLYQNLGSSGAGDPIQIGMGTTVGSNEAIFTQGSPETTGVDTDMAIEGNGFFVTDNHGVQQYTRAGDFTMGANGALLASDGSDVMGYAANTAGVIDTNQPIQALSIMEGQTFPAQATTIIGGDMSLDSAESVSYPTAQATSAIDMTAGFNPSDATGATFSQTETVYDSAGTSHVLTFNFTKSSTADEWTYNITIPGTDVGQSSASPVVVTSGTVAFDPTTGDLTNVTVDNGESGTAPSTEPGDVTGISVSDLNGGASLTFDWDIMDSSGNPTLSETSGTSGVSSVSQNGYAASAATYTTTISEVYDAQGNAHSLTLNCWKTGSNQWQYTLTIPGADVGQDATAVQVAAGTLGFDGSGQLNSVTVTSSLGNTAKVTAVSGQSGSVGNITGITIPSLADGATSLDFTWDLFNASGDPTISQAAGDSSSSIQAENGYSAGSLQSISVTSAGVIEGVFSNGQQQNVGQLAIASFANEEGLAASGNSDFQQTLASGTASIGVAGSAGRGTILGSSLEESNVDIATEFSNLIVAQQAYEANARTMTTFDNVAQDTINLIQP